MRERYASTSGTGNTTTGDIDNWWSFANMLTTAAAGDRVNFKGPHTLTGNAAFSSLGTAANPIVLRGYNSTIGDGYLGRTNGNGPLITTNMPVFSGATFNLTMPVFSIIESINMSSSRAGPMVLLGTSGAAVRCSLTNTNNSANTPYAIRNALYATIFDCDASITAATGTAAAIDSYNYPGRTIACRVDGGTANGIAVGGASVVIACTIYSSAADAIYSADTNCYVTVYGCTLVDSTSDGFHQVTGAGRQTGLFNNAITDNGVYGIYAVDEACAIFSAGNRTDRNVSGDDSGASDWLTATSYNCQNKDYSSITRANEYVDPDSGDYRLSDAAPGRKSGIPLYSDIGALQRERGSYLILRT